MVVTEGSAKLTLSYPIFCADFDPFNDDFLLVGGGGGEGKSGVANKIVWLSNSCVGHSTDNNVLRRSSTHPTRLSYER